MMSRRQVLVDTEVTTEIVVRKKPLVKRKKNALSRRVCSCIQYTLF